MATPGFSAALFDGAEGVARSAYAALLAESPQRTPFASLAFAEAVAGALGLRLRIAGVWLPDTPETWAAGAVLFEKRKGPYRAAALPESAEFVHPVLREPVDAAALHAGRSPLDALLELAGRRFHQSAFLTPPSLPDVRGLAWHGYRLRPRYTYWMPIPAEGDVEAGWRRSARKDARRHADAFTSELGTADAVVALAAGSLDRKAIGGWPAAALAKAATRLVAGGTAEARLAHDADGPAAGALLLPGEPGHAAYLWLMGSRPGPAMTVLLHRLAADVQARGRTALYLGGANTPSVAEFKRGFGADLRLGFAAYRFGRQELRWLAALRGGA